MTDSQHMFANLPAGAELAGGRYWLEARLGQGGTGAVYRALDRDSGQHVAIKLLDPARSRAGYLLKFKREFRAASRLDHPNCVKVYELGSQGDQWFFTMEYLAGGSLPKSRMPAESVAQVALQVLAALDHLHAKQIIHCDLKPQNVLMLGGPDPMPQVKLTDFGIARAGHLGESADGRFVEGSYPYLSPEQAAGVALDPRSDLYALGVNLYLLLSGELPLKPHAGAPASAWLELHRDALPPHLSRLAPEVPEPLASVVMELLAKQPGERPTSAAAVFDRVEAWAKADGVALPQVVPLQRRGVLATPELVGRRSELEQGNAWLASVLLGQADVPDALFVSGSAGVGKSRLVSALSERAGSRGAWVHTASCRAEPGMPYQALARLFRAIFDLPPLVVPPASSSATPISQSVDDATATVTMRGRAHLQSVSDRSGEAAPLGMEAAHGGQWDFLQRSTDALLKHARATPVVVVIEDLQWADTSTLELLRFWLRALSQARARGEAVSLGFLLSHRLAPDHEALAELRQTAEQTQGVASIELQSLTVDDAVQMAGSMLMRPVDGQLGQFVHKLVSRGDGSPLFLRQALQLLVSSGQLALHDQGWNLEAVDVTQLPTGVRAAAGERAARLSGETQQALAIAAVVGRRFDTRTLLDASALEEGVVLDCLDEAIRAGFVVDDQSHAGRYLFEHDGLREAVYQALEADMRERLHRAVAESVERRRSRDPAAAAEIAHHYGACGELKQAYTYGVRAARRAGEAFAFERAAELYSQAFAWAEQGGLPVEPALHEQRGDACLESGQYGTARASFGRRLETVRNQINRAELQRKVAVVEFRQGHTARACKLLESIMRKLGFGIPRTRIGVVLGLLGGMLYNAWRAKMRFRWARLVSGRRKSRARVAAAVGRQLAEGYYFLDSQRAMYFVARTLRIAEPAGDGMELAAAASGSALTFSVLGRVELAQRLFERGRRAADRHPLARAGCMMLEGMRCAYAADVEGASTRFKDSAELYAKACEPMRLRQVWVMHAQALCQAGQLERANALATKVWELAEGLDDHRGRGWARLVQGMVAIRQGKEAQAITLLQDAVHFSEAGTDAAHQTAARSRLALVMVLQGDLESALPLAERAAVSCVEDRLMHPINVADGIFLLISALAQLTRGEPDPELARRARWVKRKRRRRAQITRYVYPMYLCGVAGWELVKGDIVRAKRTTAEAVEMAESHGLWGELRDMHLVLARFFAQDNEAAAHHAAAAKQIGDRLIAADAALAGE